MLASLLDFEDEHDCEIVVGTHRREVLKMFGNLSFSVIEKLQLMNSFGLDATNQRSETQVHTFYNVIVSL